MRRFSLWLVLVMVLGFGVGGAEAANYISGNLGAGWVEDLDVNDGVDVLTFSFDVGYGVSAAVGHEITPALRAELEAGYFKSDLDEVALAGVGTAPVNGDGTLTYLMLNGFYDFMPANQISPFLGLGVGYTNAELEIEGVSEDDSVFAFQGAAGISFALSPPLKCDLQYRFFLTDDLDFGAGIASDGIVTHSAMAGLRYSF